MDSFDSESQQPSFGVHARGYKKPILKTPQTKQGLEQNSFSNFGHSKKLFNSEQPGGMVLMKTEGSVTFSDTLKPNPEKEIYTEDSNSIKIHKFEDVQGDGDMSLGKHLNYRF